MEVGGGGRRRRSPSDEDGHSGGGQTLAAVLSQKRQPEGANRTLLDIIRDDPSGTHHRKTWRTFKDKIRIRRAGAAWTSSVHVPASDVPIPSANRMMSRRQSTRFPTAVVVEDPEDHDSEENNMSAGKELGGVNNIIIYTDPYMSEQDSMPSSRGMMMRHNSSRLPNLATTSYGRGVEFSTSFNTGQDKVRVYDEGEEEEEEEERESEEASEEEGEPQVRMSLMALLAETDREMGLDGSPFMIGDDEEDEEEEEVSSGAGEYNNCCVCMVRHKGAAFIPCGHTFCRLCSRELCVQRGNCPLCNKFILEILDIF